MTFRSLLVSILTTDAQSAEAGSLGALLDHREVAPYGVFFLAPPKEPEFPLITYFVNIETGKLPRIIPVNITVWAEDDTYDTALQRIYTLLHNQQEKFITTTDFAIKRIEWNWESADQFDSAHRVYYRQARYYFYAIKQ